MFYLHWALQPGARVQLPTAHPERAVYVATGSAERRRRRTPCREGRAPWAPTRLAFISGTSLPLSLAVRIDVVDLLAACRTNDL
jgi:redox-sensitive bicupin YhaK (pirin superfamily)